MRMIEYSDEQIIAMVHPRGCHGMPRIIGRWYTGDMHENVYVSCPECGTCPVLRYQIMEDDDDE